MKPSQGEIWVADLNPARGHEQAGKRPCLIVSVDLFNHGPAGLAVVMPITTRRKGIPFHVEIGLTESGLREISFIKCEDIRSISTERLTGRLGKVSQHTLELVQERLRILMGL
ncbi:type II toxin-antitoxin system PemK/MazF family toxin [Metallumcola ferriviriculae]|uniref:mRNA interferase n=1 Tax=Metallumcola ferriviriculae TaxID=3039180 RepID=A0AAU0UN56_9FIRM|nr:type II toxin-antitoxin system PemK/MazF family toxin [Desulfitibacteraceae bacterium MK1]